jgi:predicted dehydrogenase
MTQKVNVAIIGTRFMGRAHSNAWANVARHFKLDLEPIMKVAVGRQIDEHIKSFANQYGWESVSDTWEDVVNDPGIDVVDISTSNKSHYPIAIAAIKARKHVICEKPLAMTADEAKEMYLAANDAGVVHMTAFNYRQVPAIIYAKQLIKEGKIGDIHHFDAVYYQDWLIDPDFPFVWRNDIVEAGSGAHGDMNAHLVDLARYLVGEVTDVSGTQAIFVKERRVDDGPQKREVTADDATSFLCHFDNGALGSFITSRFATGRKNYLKFELFGSKGSLKFELERLNELQYYSTKDDQGDQGFRTILMTENVHPFINAWWPPGHIIGWEHTFIHEVKQFLDAIASKSDLAPSFYDGWKTQAVMDAVVNAAEKKQWVQVEA